MPRTEIARVLVSEPDTDCPAGWLGIEVDCDAHNNCEGCQYNILPHGQFFNVDDEIVLHDDGSIEVAR